MEGRREKGASPAFFDSQLYLSQNNLYAKEASFGVEYSGC